MPAPARRALHFLPRLNGDAPGSFGLNAGFKHSAGEGARAGSAFLSFYRTPRSSRAFIISGITKDSTGAPIGGCTVKLYTATDDVLRYTAISDLATGAYSFSVPSNGWTFYAVAYLAGSPDVAGTTVNTLKGA